MKLNEAFTGAIGAKDADTLIEAMLPSTTSSIIFLGTICLDWTEYCGFNR